MWSRNNFEKISSDSEIGLFPVYSQMNQVIFIALKPKISAGNFSTITDKIWNSGNCSSEKLNFRISLTVTITPKKDLVCYSVCCLTWFLDSWGVPNNLNCDFCYCFLFWNVWSISLCKKNDKRWFVPPSDRTWGNWRVLYLVKQFSSSFYVLMNTFVHHK